jgi:hypothetical protein
LLLSSALATNVARPHSPGFVPECGAAVSRCPLSDDLVVKVEANSMTDLLFDTPWWLPTLIAVVGGWMLIDGNKRGNDRFRNAGAAVFLVAVLLAVVSYFVDTDKETVLKRTRALVDAVEQKDWQRFESLLDEGTSLAGRYSGKQEMVEGAKRSSVLIGLKKAYVRSTEARQTGTLITVTMNALSEQDMPPYPMQSKWELDWQQRGDRWLLDRVTLQNVSGEDGQAFIGRLPAVSRGQ